MQLNQDSPNIQDSGEICEVSTTVDKDEDSEHDQQKTRKSNSVQDEVIDVETEEKAKEVKSEPQVILKSRPFGLLPAFRHTIT